MTDVRDNLDNLIDDLFNTPYEYEATPEPAPVILAKPKKLVNTEEDLFGEDDFMCMESEPEPELELEPEPEPEPELLVQAPLAPSKPTGGWASASHQLRDPNTPIFIIPTKKMPVAPHQPQDIPPSIPGKSIENSQPPKIAPKPSTSPEMTSKPKVDASVVVKTSKPVVEAPITNPSPPNTVIKDTKKKQATRKPSFLKKSIRSFAKAKKKSSDKGELPPPVPEVDYKETVLTLQQMALKLFTLQAECNGKRRALHKTLIASIQATNDTERDNFRKLCVNKREEIVQNELLMANLEHSIEAIRSGTEASSFDNSAAFERYMATQNLDFNAVASSSSPPSVVHSFNVGYIFIYLFIFLSGYLFIYFT